MNYDNSSSKNVQNSSRTYVRPKSDYVIDYTCSTIVEDYYLKFKRGAEEEEEIIMKMNIEKKKNKPINCTYVKQNMDYLFCRHIASLISLVSSAVDVVAASATL